QELILHTNQDENVSRELEYHVGHVDDDMDIQVSGSMNTGGDNSNTGQFEGEDSEPVDVSIQRYWPVGDEENEEDLRTAAEASAMEQVWEPERPQNMDSVHDSEHEQLFQGSDDSEVDAQREQNEARLNESNGFYTTCYSDKYPSRKVGAVLQEESTRDERYGEEMKIADNPWEPFASKLDWEVAHWAKMRGPGSTSFSELLAINRYKANVLSSTCAIFWSV
ncbi:hypothetical protein K435DRAFT_813215, partial [Dendrothele bispora CBS 962.96]